MKRIMKTAILCGVLLVMGAAVGWANNGISPWNHRQNPAYFAFGTRRYAELGLSVDATIGNSVLGTHELFAETLTIDLDELYDRTPDRGLRLGANTNAELHFLVHVGRVGLGLYSDTSSITRITVPQSFIELLAKGNELDEDYSGSTEFMQRSFTETGLYGSYPYREFLIAGKLGMFAPGIYTEDAEATYKLETLSDGTVRGEVGAEGKAYTSFGDEGIEGLGVNVSLGLIRPDADGKPKYGGAVNNIPIAPARPGYVIDLEESRFTFESESILQAINDEEDPFETTDQEGDFDARKLDSGDRPSVHMPISVSGFYRFAVPVVDVIPTGEVVFGDYPRLNAGAQVEGNFFPVNMLSVGLGYRDFFWHANAGVRLPFRPVELAVQLRSAAPEISGVWGRRGLGATISLAIGW